MTSSAEFEVLAGSERKALHRHCFGLKRDHDAAEDLFQETMVRAWRGFRNFSGDANGFRAWAMRIATNIHIASRGRPTIPMDDDPFGVDKAFTADGLPQDAIEARSLPPRMLAAIGMLPPRWARPFVLLKVVGLSDVEAATYLGVPLGTVHSSCYRAKTMLKEILGPLPAEGFDALDD